MRDRLGEPRLLMGAGLVLLAVGYAALRSDVSGWWIAGSRVAFYCGLVALLAGVVVWLQRPPAPDPANDPDDEPLEKDF
jgi:membrane protein implicated in regulation of membrane protease activity